MKWPGGKRWLVPRLRDYWDGHCGRRLVEPFCGGLAITLGLAPGRALLNDLNPHLVSFFQWLQRGLQVALPMENDEALYYAHRRRFNELVRAGRAGAREAAELFYYLNRTGYNGLCRFNRSGEYNVPFGRYRRINYTRDFSPYRAALGRWTFTCRDFEALPLDPADFIYADPPYDVEFRQYSRPGFAWADQVRLARWLAAHPGPVLSSNQATDRVVTLYRELGFELLFLDGPRRISCTGDRTPAREILALRGV